MGKVIWPVASVLWALLIFRLTTYPQLVVSQDSFLQLVITMAAHVVFFGIQGLLLYKSKVPLLLSIVTASGYGLLIELIQRSVPGRSADPVDWALDTAGALVFVLLMGKYTYIHKEKSI